MELTQDDVIQILKLMEESDFDELRLEHGSVKLVVSRSGNATIGEGSASVTEARTPERLITSEKAQARLIAEEKPPAVVTEVKLSSEIVTAKIEVGKEGLVAIKAPMMGTFYRAPTPDAPPFVDVGSNVTEDDTVGLIEVMKCFSSIMARVRGKIVKVNADSGQMVQSGQELFLVKPPED